MRVELVLAYNPGAFTGAGTNTWFLDGQVPTLIDAGSGDARHRSDVASLAGERGLSQVLVTHGHVDHAGGARGLRAQWPGARFAKLPWAGEDDRYRVPWEALADDEAVPAGDSTLWALHTPGHSPDHLVFFEPRSGVLFAGDLVMNGGTVVIPASRGGDLAAYLHSLRRVLDLQPRRILPGHGAPIEQPSALIRGYIAHRLARERQILDVLGLGAAPVAAIVASVYPQLQPDLLPAAADSVLAHLRKLEREGRAAEESGEAAGQPVWRLG